MKRFVWAPFEFLIFLWTRLPRSVQFFFGDGLGIFCFDILRLRRKIILDNVQRAFPEKSKRERVQMGRKSLMNLGRSLTEYSSFLFVKCPLLDRVHLTGFENIERALEKRRGVCLLSLHLGNMGLIPVFLVRKGYALAALQKTFQVKWIQKILWKLREKNSVELLSPRDSAYAVLKALKNNHCVFFAMDQFMGPPIGVPVKFFGHETGAALGLAVMARRSRAPVIPIYSFRDERGETHIHVDTEIPFGAKGKGGVAHMTQVYTDWVEKQVRAQPEQWMWLHRRWKRFQVL